MTLPVFGAMRIRLIKLWEIRNNDREPGETEEEYVDRKALEEEIVIIESNLPSFETAKKLIELGV